MKKILVLGVLAFVIIGCIVAAGCTSASTDTQTTTEDQIIGTWLNEDGDRAFVFLIDNNGGIYQRHDGVSELYKSFTWKKNSDGTYAVTEPGADTSIKVSLDAVKGQILLETGDILNKQIAKESGTVESIELTRIEMIEDSNIEENISSDNQYKMNYTTLSPTTIVFLDKNVDSGSLNTDGDALISLNSNKPDSINRALHFIKSSENPFETSCKCLGYFTEKTGGTKVLNEDGSFAADTIDPYITDGKWVYSGNTLTLYAHWEE